MNFRISRLLFRRKADERRRPVVTGTAAVLAGLALLGAISTFARNESPMPIDKAMLKKHYCAVLGGWAERAPACADEAPSRRDRPPTKPQHADEAGHEETIWRQVIAIVVKLLDIQGWLPGTAGLFRVTAP